MGAGAGGLDGGVERQQLGLVGHLLDDAGEGGDLRELVGEALDALALGAHGLDGLHDARQDRRAALDLGCEVGAHARRLLAGARRVLGAAVQRLDGDGHALELVADLVHARGHRRGAHGGAGAAAAEGEHGAMDAADHVGDGAGQIGELVGGVGVAPGRGRGEVPGGVVRLDLRLGREGGVQHGPFIGQKPAAGVGHVSVACRANAQRRVPKKSVSSAAHSSASSPPSSSGRWLRRGCARTSSTLPAAPAFGSVVP